MWCLDVLIFRLIILRIVINKISNYNTYNEFSKKKKKSIHMLNFIQSY